MTQDVYLYVMSVDNGNQRCPASCSQTAPP
jgi:hypothetical protein